MFKVFIISFGVIALIYAILAATTKIFYKNKSVAELSLLERNILYGRATFGDRILLFGSNLFASYASPPIYITSGLITFIFWLISSFATPENNPKDSLISAIQGDTTTYVYFKDGVKIPRNLFFLPCVESTRQKSGDLIYAEEYCSCCLDKITKYFTASEFVSFSKNKDSIGNSINFFNSEIGKKISLECLPDNVNLTSKVNYPADAKRILITQFKIEIQNDHQLNDLLDVDKYCECLVNKIMRIYTYPEFYKLSTQQTLSTNSKFLQARDECLKESYR